jgi:hypothetical protein
MAGSSPVALSVKTRFSIAAFALLLSCDALPALAESNPVELATAFCAAQTENDESRLRGMMTDDLVSVITEAERRNAAIAETSGEADAPLANGIPYRSFEDPPAACRAGKIAPSANVTIVDIAYAATSKSGEWTDRIVLKVDNGELRVDDILFAMFPTDTYSAGLRRLLVDSFDQ